MVALRTYVVSWSLHNDINRRPLSTNGAIATSVVSTIFISWKCSKLLIIFFLSGSYPISESMQTLNGVTGESVLSTTSTGYHDDTEYHRLDTAAPPSGFYDNNATEFYPVPEHKYRPPLVRMNSGMSRFYYSLNSKTRGLLSKVGSTRGAYSQEGAYCFNVNDFQILEKFA